MEIRSKININHGVNIPPILSIEAASLREDCDGVD